MTSFRILSEASEELEACVSYYNSQWSNLGTEFFAEFERTAERIPNLPNAARMVGNRRLFKARSSCLSCDFLHYQCIWKKKKARQR